MTHHVIQVILVRDVHADPSRLSSALGGLDQAGLVVTDTTYTARMGVVTGQVTEEDLPQVVGHPAVRAWSRRQAMHALDTPTAEVP